MIKLKYIEKNLHSIKNFKNGANLPGTKTNYTKRSISDTLYYAEMQYKTHQWYIKIIKIFMTWICDQ